ncbi:MULTISPECIES: 50S ribosomal protein L20 [unclassified Shimia]|uniref:50S ribosomal protein L20 n=1 Tax=unclassified Shimia TaxID=2630038 RepID=UPI003107B240
MSLKWAVIAGLVALAGCGSGNGAVVGVSSDTGESYSSTVNAETDHANVTKSSIETCWTRAGLKGDIYKFMTPEEAAGLKSVGGASDSQVTAFRSCLTS